MLFDGNFRLDETQDKLITLDFDIVELIRRNELGKLNSGEKIVPLLVSDVLDLENRLERNPLVALPMRGENESFYCINNPKNKNSLGGFVYDSGILYFALGLLNLVDDRDSYRQIPNIMFGTYFTNLSFEQIIKCFESANIPLIKTIDDNRVYYDRTSWPEGQIPNLGKISYNEALNKLGF